MARGDRLAGHRARRGPAELSTVATSGAAGLIAAVLLGGVAADRLPGRTIFIAVESVKTVGVAAGATLALSGMLELWQLALVTLVLGIADGFFFLHIRLWSPGAAFVVVAASQLLAVVGLALLRATPVRREKGEPQHPLTAITGDLAGGFRYMVKTPWLLATLLHAGALILIIMGPIEVLLPFAVRDQTGKGAGAFAFALAAFGVGGAARSMVVASCPWLGATSRS